ncbi:hypothetical protein [Dactylosporangium sp. NPDC006015]|uniref:hypothetical protein n=1 Tax=Dactylosporangium sp. NPDC006015 TaxID=3154576 RepID=UPI0033A7031D
MLDKIELRLRATAPGEPARLLSRRLSWRAEHGMSRSAPLLELVARLADRLRGDGVAVTNPSGSSFFSELDVYDLFVAEGIPFELDVPRQIELSDWFADDGPGRRPLLSLGTHPVFEAEFRKSCLWLLGDHRFGADVGGFPIHPNLLARALSVPGVAAALTAEVDALTASLGAAPLGEVQRIMYRLGTLRSPAGYAAFKPFLERIAALDAPAALARTLRCGLPEELVWPPYEQASAALDAGTMRTDQEWPLLAIHDAGTAVVLGPSGVVARHELAVPARDGIDGQFPPRCTLHDGRLLVSWQQGGGERGYWADTPGVEFDADLGGLVLGPMTRLPVSEDIVPGGRFEPVPGAGPVRLRWRRDLWPDAPAVFGAADGVTGWDVIDTAGAADGVTGWNVVDIAGGAVVRSVDGRQVPLPPTVRTATIMGVLALPGGGDRLVTVDQFGAVTVWDPATGTPAYGPAKPEGLPPAGWWDLLRPRDPAGSAALRAGGPVTAVTDPVLADAVGRQAAIAATLAATVEQYRALRHEPARPPVPVTADDVTIADALSGLTHASRFTEHRRESRTSTVPEYKLMGFLDALPAALDGERPRPSAGVAGWTRVLAGLGAVALRAAMPTTRPPEREVLAALLTALADAGLADGSAGLSVLTVVTDDQLTAERTAGLGMRAVVAEGVSGGFGLSCRRLIVHGPVFDRPGLRVVERIPLAGWGTAGTVRRFVDLLAERGPVTWRPEWAASFPNLPVEQATVLLTGATYCAAADDVTVPPSYLEVTGLSAAAARTASDAIAALPKGRLLHLLNAAMPLDPAALWESGPDTARLASAWREPSPPPYEFQPWLE